MNDPNSHRGPRAISRLMTVLKVLSSKPDGASLSDLIASTSSPKSSLQHLLGPLLDDGYVIHQGGRYHLGAAMFRLASRVMTKWDFPKIIRPLLLALVEQVNETVVLSTLDTDEKLVSYVEIIESRATVRYHIPVGTVRPVFTTAAGKVMAAFSTGTWLSEYLDEVTFPLKANHDLTRETLLAEIEAIRQDHIYVSIDKFTQGVAAAACPVFNADGACIAAITVAGPTGRFVDNLPFIRQALLSVSRKASGLVA